MEIVVNHRSWRGTCATSHESSRSPADPDTDPESAPAPESHPEHSNTD
jgi:hypothetical protein